MKKLVLTISASLLLVIGAMAQVDLSFDSTWINDAVGSLQDARGWTSFNTASFEGMAQTVFRVTNNPAYGIAAAKVETAKVPATVQVPNPMRHGQPNFDTVGLLCVGTINIANPSPLTFGEPISVSSPPVYLSFYSKDSVVAGDSSFVLAYLTKWGTPVAGKLDTIASGKLGESNTGSTGWASHSITMIYGPGTAGIIPDSQQIFVSSSIYSHGGAKIGSKYYVDQFCWDCTAGINELHGNASISVYPNPASDIVSFSSTVNASYVEVYDITSRKFGMYPMQNNKVQIQTETFPPGLYIYDVLNEKKEVISRGKFEIAK